MWKYYKDFNNATSFNEIMLKSLAKTSEKKFMTMTLFNTKEKKRIILNFV